METLTRTDRAVNFNPGPGALPVEVLEEAREALVNYKGTGIGILEHSHRSKAVDPIFDEAEADARELLGLSEEWAVLFLQGGARTQFFHVPMNFLDKDKVANYLDTGTWAAGAMEEAEIYGKVHVACSSRADNYTYIPTEANYDPTAVYTHFTSNNTIFGTQFQKEPVAPQLLVCDASSDIMSRRIDINKYAMIYAGAQKNLGPAGATFVVIRKDFAEKGRKDIAKMAQYRVQVKNGSRWNTPPVFAVYIVGLVFKWLKRQGGIAAMEKVNNQKAEQLYATLDSSDFFKKPVRKDSRSKMNVVFRLPSEELEEKFIKEANKAKLMGLKGHRSVGGMRASIYNAISKAEVDQLCSFLKEFERTNG